MRSAPRAFAAVLVVRERRPQPFQNLRRRLEHCLELRLVNLVDILTEVIDRLFEAGAWIR